LRRLTVYSLLLAIIVVSSVWLHIFPHAYALTSYAPGVKAGDSVTYGKFSVNNTSPYPPFPGNVSALAIQVKSANPSTNTVTAMLLTTYRNGSLTNQTLTGTTDTGQGNLLPYILAGGLRAGDPLLKSSPYLSLSVNETVNKIYAGALRSVNVLNITYQSSYANVKAAYYWDVNTGLLLEAYENASFTSPSGPVILQIYFEATATNVWTLETTPDFTLDASAQTFGPHLGETASYRLDLASFNRFNGTVSLAPSLLGAVPPHAPRVTLSSASLLVTSGSRTATSILTFASNSSTQLGTYLVNINATSGMIAHVAVIAVTLAPPDYTIDANPGNLTLFEGSSKNSTITIASRGVFTGTVALQAQSFGSLVTIALSKSTVALNSTNTSAQVIAKVTANTAVPPGVTTVYINGVSGSTYRSTSIFVNVTGPDFRITATPPLLTFKEGQSAVSTITLTSILGFAGIVTVSSSASLPVTAALTNTSLSLTAGGKASTNLTVSTPASGPPGIYAVYVFGASANLSHSIYVNLNVTGPDFRFTSSTSFMSLQTGRNGNVTLTLSAVGGFSGTINLTSGTFGPVTVAVTPSSITLNYTRLSSTALLTVTAPNGAAPGYDSVTVTATSGNLIRSVYVTVQVIGPDFTISVNPSSLTIPQGGSGKSMISLSSLNNFTGSVNLSASSPFGFQAVITPTSVTLSAGGVANSTLTVHVPLAFAPGYYYLTVIGGAGQLQHTSFVSVQVTGPDFSISSFPSFLNMRQGSAANSTITLTSLNNFRAPVTLTVTTYFATHVSVSPTSTILLPAPNGTVTTVLTFSTSSTTPPGDTFFTVTATSGNLTRTTYVEVNVIGPDFGLSVNPFSFALRPGASGSATVTLTSVDGFAGNVNVTLSTLAFVNATLASHLLRLAANGTATTSLTIRVPLSAQPGGFDVIVNATSGFITHTQFIFVQIITPDFVLQANPFTLQVAAGRSAQSTITITGFNGFNGTIALSTFGFSPPGVNVTLSRSSVTLLGGSDSVTLTVSASPGVVSQSFFVNVQGTGGGLSRSTSVYVTITSPDFTLTSSPTFLTVPRGSSSNSTLIITSLNGFSGNVSLTASLVVSGLNASLTSVFSVTFSPKIVFVASGSSATSTVSIVVPSSTVPGFYGVVVRAASGAIVRTSFIQVQVTGTSFSISSAPIFLQLNAGTSGMATIFVSALNGFNGQVSLSAVLSPAGLNATLSRQVLSLNSTVTSASSALTIGVPAHPITGYYTVTLTGSGGGLNQTASVLVLVTAVDFTLQAQPGSLTVFQGASNSSTISVSSINGFSGQVTLRALVLPASIGISLSFSTADLFVSSNHTSTSVLTVSDSPTAAPGSYSVEVVASGTTPMNTPIGHSIIISLTVAAKPDFQLIANPPTISIVQGSSGTTTLNATSVNSFAGTVTLTSTVSLQGPTVSIANTAIVLTSGGTTLTTLTMSAGTNSVGYFTIIVTAQGGGIIHSVNVQVYIAPKPDFSISAISSSLAVQAGSSDSTALSLKSLNGFTGTVQVFPLVSVAGVSFTPSVYVTSLSAGGTVNVTVAVNVAATTSPGTYTITFVGNATIGTHSTIMTLTVAPPPDFVLTGSNSGMVIASGSSASSTVSIAPIRGFTGPVSLSTSAPAGITGSFSPNPVLGGSGSSTLTLSVALTVAAGNYTVTVVGTGGSFSHTVSLLVAVSSATRVTLVEAQVSWSHRLSLSKNSGVQTWTLLVKNPGKTPVYIQVAVAGNSTSSGRLFSLKTQVTLLSPGASLTVTLSQSFTGSSIGSKFNFAVNLFYGSGISASGNIVSPITSLVAKGWFVIVA
jgi:uncharacterized membrane protein